MLVLTPKTAASGIGFDGSASLLIRPLGSRCTGSHSMTTQPNVRDGQKRRCRSVIATSTLLSSEAVRPSVRCAQREAWGVPAKITDGGLCGHAISSSFRRLGQQSCKVCGDVSPSSQGLVDLGGDALVAPTGLSRTAKQSQSRSRTNSCYLRLHHQARTTLSVDGKTAAISNTSS